MAPHPEPNESALGARRGQAAQGRLTLTLGPSPFCEPQSGKSIAMPLPLHAPRRLAQEAAALGDLTQQVRGPPACTIALMPGRDLVIDLASADGVGPVHQPAAVARKAEAIEPHHVNVAGANGFALL